MDSDNKSAPPPYSRLAGLHNQRSTVPAIPNVNRARLVDDLSQARTHHLREIVSSKILPIIEQRAHLGLSHTEIALLPSKHTISPAGDDFDASDLRNLDNIDNDDGVIQVQLTTPMDNPRFWKQDAVVKELRGLILETLESDADGDVDSVWDAKGAKDSAGKQANLTKQDISTTEAGTTPRPSRLAKLTTIIRKEMTTLTKLSNRSDLSDSIRVKADTQEICSRTMNEYGLYESTTDAAVVVDIRIGDC